MDGERRLSLEWPSTVLRRCNSEAGFDVGKMVFGRGIVRLKVEDTLFNRVSSFGPIRIIAQLLV